jgi:hypothetical protein
MISAKYYPDWKILRKSSKTACFLSIFHRGRRVTTDDKDAPLPWLVHQLLDATARSARGTAAIAVRLCALLTATPVIAAQYEAVLLHLLTFVAPDLDVGNAAEVRCSCNTFSDTKRGEPFQTTFL